MSEVSGEPGGAWADRVDELRRRYGVVGAQFGIVKLDAAGRPREQFVVASGDAESSVPVTRDTLFEIGSVTKMWTTVLILQLVAENALSLDTPICDILPEFALRDPAAGAVTVGMLLTHTSGIEGDIFVDTGQGDDGIERYVASLRTARMLYAAGSRFSYCNSGFVIAGRIVEVVRGARWSDALTQFLIAPLGLSHTLPGHERGDMPSAVGHLDSPNGPRAVTDRIPTALAPAGLITSTADDMLGFGRMLLCGGAAPSGAGIVDATLVAAMGTPIVDLRGVHHAALGWGLGAVHERWGCAPAWGHDGATIGQRAFLRLFPQQRTAAVLLTTGGRADGMFRSLFECAAGDQAPTALSSAGRVRSAPERSYGFADAGVVVSNAPTGARLVVVDPSPTGGEPQRAAFDLYDSDVPGVWAWTTPDLDGWAPFRIVDGGAYLGLRYLPERSPGP